MDNAQEKRKYMRLNSVFPIEFRAVSRDDRRPVSELYEGFTRDIGKGGMGIFYKVLKETDRFNFIPHETRLKIMINIPLDKDPIESFATVEWIEKQPGPVVDTYTFGISYDFINEIEYEKIIAYVRWLRLKPKLVSLAVVLLAVALVISSGLLVRLYNRKAKDEVKLSRSLIEEKRAKTARFKAEEEASEAQAGLESAEGKRVALQAVLERLTEKKKTLEEMSRLSEEDKRELQLQVEDLAMEKALLEERIESEAGESAERSAPPDESPEIKEAGGISDERIRSEEPNYIKLRELILNEKAQSLDAYVSTHRSSIYHAASLFALAEIRYKQGNRAFAVVSYDQVIELYPKSKYALYSSYRLEQLGNNYVYDSDDLPEEVDYRNIEPYAR